MGKAIGNVKFGTGEQTMAAFIQASVCIALVPLYMAAVIAAVLTTIFVAELIQKVKGEIHEH